MVHPVKLGRTTRMSYSRIEEVLDMPNLIEVQKNSYKWFLEEGLARCSETFLPFRTIPGTGAEFRTTGWRPTIPSTVLKSVRKGILHIQPR